MQVVRWGNGLAVKLPASIVQELGLQDGDEVTVEVANERGLRVVSSQARMLALQRLRRLDWILPPGLEFSRGEGS